MRAIYLNAPYKKQDYSRCSRSPAVTRSGTIYYPIWLAYAAGYARDCLADSVDIELVDAVAHKWDQDDLIRYLTNGSSPNLIVCETTTPSIYEDIKTAGAIKEAWPDCVVVMTGTHATALPGEVLNADMRIDVVARGEYDRTLVELIQAIQTGSPWDQVRGITFRSGDELITTPDQPLIEDLDSLPFVSEIYRDFLNINNYFFAAARFPMIMTMTSRGCPFRCQWCLYPQVMHRGKYRQRSPENVAGEFAWVRENMPSVREIGIEDDLFTGDKQRLHRICELLIAQDNRIPFWCDTRVDLDYETMRLMKAAGCRLLIVGFESGDQTLLDTIHKGTKVEASFDFMANARRAGLIVHGCFVLGNPGETTQTMQKTIDLAIQLNPDTAQFFPVIAYPGTLTYQWAVDNGYLNTSNFEHWLNEKGLHNSVIDMPQLSAREVMNGCDQARRVFYLRNNYVMRKIGQSLTSVHEARRNVKAFLHLARHLVVRAS